MGGMNSKRPSAVKGTMHHASTSFSTKILAGAIISVVQYLAPLRYMFLGLFLCSELRSLPMRAWLPSCSVADMVSLLPSPQLVHISQVGPRKSNAHRLH
jgi:hypothetical protein